MLGHSSLSVVIIFFHGSSSELVSNQIWKHQILRNTYYVFHLDYSKSSNFQIFSGISPKIDLVIFAFVKKYPSGLLHIYVSDLPELKFLAVMKKSEIFISVQFRVHCRSVQSSQKNKFRIQEKW